MKRKQMAMHAWNALLKQARAWINEQLDPWGDTQLAEDLGVPADVGRALAEALGSQPEEPLNAALLDLRKAQDAVTAAAKEAFPLETPVRFRRGHGIIHGTVAGHDTGEWAGKMRIRHRRTGKYYRIWVASEITVE